METEATQTVAEKNQKVRELAILILDKFPEGLPEEKLYAIMFYADMRAYWKFGKSISGATYIKGESEPIPVLEEENGC